MPKISEISEIPELKQFDIIIIGGGLAGLTLANTLINNQNNNNQKNTIALIEAKNMNILKNNNNSNNYKNSHLDNRYIALSLNSKILLEDINIWRNLSNKATPIQKIEVSDQGGFGKTYLSSSQEKLPALGYNVIIRDLGEALLNNINNIKIFENTRVTNINSNIKNNQNNQNNISELILNDSQNNSQKISGKLIIATDGANSTVRKLLDLKAETKSYNQYAIITTIQLKREHTDTAYERFTPDGPIGLIPCIINNQKNQMSLVWATTEQKAKQLTQMPKQDFLEKLQIEFGYKCGKFIDCGNRITYPLNQTVMPKPYHNNIIFIGNAAHTLHPVAGQGFNLSLTEIMKLSDLLNNNNLDNLSDIKQIISQFISEISKNQNSIISITEDLINIFSNNTPIIKHIRRFVLNKIDQIQPIKTKLNNKMMGLT
jgi:2-octaprenyl-6-methoxyphenol hydroxylase